MISIHATDKDFAAYWEQRSAEWFTLYRESEAAREALVAENEVLRTELAHLNALATQDATRRRIRAQADDEVLFLINRPRRYHVQADDMSADIDVAVFGDLG